LIVLVKWSKLLVLMLPVLAAVVIFRRFLRSD
jgi:hypothetical protein